MMEGGGKLDEEDRHRGLLVESLRIALLLTGVLLVYFYDVAFLGKTLRVSNTIPTALRSGHYDYPGGFPKYMPVYDNTPAVLEEPYQEFKARSFAEGIFPLWNPHQAGGYPFLATLESSLLFAPEIVLYVLPPLYAWDFYLLLRLLLAGTFTYAFVRLLGLGRLSALTAALSYMFSGPILSWVTNVTTNADLLTPLLLLLIELILRHPARRYVAFAGIVIFQVVAAGHPEHTFLTLLTGFIYAAFRLVQNEYRSSRRKASVRLVIALVAGLGLSAVLLIPFVEYLFFNAWHVHGEGVGLQAVTADKAITMVLPWYYSRELVSYDGWRYNTWPGGWIGLLPFILALFAVFTKGITRARIPVAFLFVVYLLKIYGIPPVSWAGYLPVFDLVKFPLHMTQTVAFCGAVLCGIAVYALQTGAGRLGTLALVTISLLALIAAATVIYPPPQGLWNAIVVAAPILAAALVVAVLAAFSRISRRALGGAMAALLALELFLLIPRERVPRAEAFRVPRYVEWLREDPESFRVYGIDGCLFPNTATAFGLDDIGLYEGLFVRNFASYIRELVDGRFFTEESFHAFRSEVVDPGNRFLDLLNLKYFILPADASVPPEQQRSLSLRPVYQGEVKIFERLGVLPRAMVLHRADFVSDEAAALSLLGSGYDFRRRVLLLGSAPEGEAANGEAIGNSWVEESSYGINRKRFRVSMQRPGYLVVNDVHYPGWKAKVDERPAEILRANYLFQAVRVTEGEHEINFDFEPRSVRGGLVLSVLSGLLLAIWWARGRHKRHAR